MKTILLIFVIVCVNTITKAQFIRQNDSVFFGPGLMLIDKHERFARHWNNSNGGYRRDLRGLSYQTLNLYVRYRYGYNRADFQREIEERSDLPRDFDPMEVTSVRNAYLGVIPCNLINVKARKYNPYRDRHSLFKHHHYVIQMDTTIHNIIDVCAYEMFKRRATRRRFIRKFSSLELTRIEDFPSNQLAISVHADSIVENDIIFDDQFDEVGILQCMTAENIKSEFSRYYLPEMDSLMERFEYEKVRLLLRQQFERELRLDWENYKNRLYQEFKKYGDISVQKEYSIRERMTKGEIGLDDFMNYTSANHIPTVFDTLCRIHLRHALFTHIIDYPEYQIYFDNSAFQGITKFELQVNYARFFDDLEVRLVVQDDLRNYIYRKYLDGKSEYPECELLLDSPHNVLYAFKNDASSEEFWNLVSIIEKTPGHWQAQVNPLNAEIDPRQLNEAMYFNGLTTFINGNNYVVIDSTASGFRYNWIDTFPDKSEGFDCAVFVQDNNEVRQTLFNNVTFYSPLVYDVAGVAELVRESWKEEGTANPNEDNFILRSIEPSKVIYFGQDIADLNHDGIYEMFSFAVSNGKPVYFQCYTVKDRYLIKLSDAEALQILGNNALFTNLLKYSSLQ